jgi:GcrA cell cycle regulator
MLRKVWDDALVERLKNLQAAGNSASMIARELGEGITRNAVIGKINRLGLSLNGQAWAYTYSRPAKPKKPKPVPAYLIDFPLGTPEPKPCGALETMLGRGLCQYIHGDPLIPGWRMCGHATVAPHSPWCAHHYAKCYSPREKAA